ncbi:MAG: GNAT family N-acetyltransferase [Bacteroidota bacterium]
MNISYRQAIEVDTETIRSILESQKLPTESVGTGATEFYLALHSGAIVGIAGYEYYGEDVLLRSVAVPSNLQKSGIGSQLVDWMIAFAKQKGVKRIILLTETASKFFAKKGFIAVDRSSIKNDPMKKSSQLGSCCCSSAICMKLDL